MRIGRAIVLVAAILAVVVLPPLPVDATVIPSFVAVSAIASSTGADVTITLPATWEPGDVFLVLGLVYDQDDSVTMTGYTAMTGTPFNRGVASRYWLFWKRATTSEGNPVFDKSGATGTTFALLGVYRGAKTTGTPFDVIGAAATGTSDPASCTALTTLQEHVLLINALGGEDDNNAAVTTTATNPRAAWVEHYTEAATGTGGMIAFSEFQKAETGSTGAVSVDFGTANPVGWGCMNLSLAGPAGGGGADGFNSLVKVTTTSESPGANCANGGTKVTVESGLDNGDGGGTARDGTLQSGEVDATTIYYSCKGDTGATGSPGADGFNSLVKLSVFLAAEGGCSFGGLRVDSGLDNGDGGGIPRNGVLETGEIDATAYVCNGSPGADGAPGHDALVALTSEPSGANCAQGGTKIESGTDLDDDGTLDPGEVTFTEYACDGPAGANGTQGPTGPAGGSGPRGPRGFPGDAADVAMCGWAVLVVLLLLVAHVFRKKRHVPIVRPPEEG